MRVLILALTLALAACGNQPAAQHEESAEAASAEHAEPTSTQTSSAQEALAALPSWDQARNEGVDFRGVGQEPGWILDVYQSERIVLVWDYGEQRIDLPRSAPTYPQEGATRYEAHGGGHTLVVTTRRTPCQDAMSGEQFPATVEVVIDGRTLNGCGRSV